MRLLKNNDDGKFSLASFFGDNIPWYAILSNIWRAEEVTFKDLMYSTSKHKASYSKIQFYGKEAMLDGLQYFLAHICCIDKSDSTQLSETMNCMFRWHRDATTSTYRIFQAFLLVQPTSLRAIVISVSGEQVVHSSMGSQRVYCASINRVGLIPQSAEDGDLDCILFGCSVLVVFESGQGILPALLGANGRSIRT